jgi:hypothetical protein
MIKILNPNAFIPSADTLRRDLTSNFKMIKNIVRQQLQVSDLINYLI